MAIVISVLGFWMIGPVILIGINSFNTAPNIIAPATYGFDNWRTAFQDPDILRAVWNTFVIFGVATAIDFPISVVIAWSLARVRMPFTYGLEFLFWVAFLVPGISVTVGWMLLADPDFGFINIALSSLPFIEFDEGPFNIFSLAGIIWVHIMGRGIAAGVVLLTPAFRNMDMSLEEAGRVSGASTLRTMIRVTLPLMVPAMVVVFAVRFARMFESFETEQLLGVPFGFFVYSTKLVELARISPVNFPAATALGSIVLILVAFIIPIQRWLLNRRQYTTVTGSFKPGRIDLGLWSWVLFAGIIFVLLLLILAPLFSLLLASFMRRTGIFILDPIFTLEHYRFVFGSGQFWESVRNTLTLASWAAIMSPLLFSMLAYLIVRTNWMGRNVLDSLIWVSAVIPGVLSGLGLLWLFLKTPFLVPLYGSLIPLMLVVLVQGNTTGVQLSKAFFLQIGRDMEEQARVAGAGWWRTYFTIWLRLMMPLLVFLAVFNFMLAATTVSSIILIAPRGTQTLSILALDLSTPGFGEREAGGIVSLIIMLLSVGVALSARSLGMRLGIRERKY